MGMCFSCSRSNLWRVLWKILLDVLVRDVVVVLVAELLLVNCVFRSSANLNSLLSLFRNLLL